MQKCEVIAICNQKGGVGKTTTTFNLGVALSKLGKKVLLIDADPQNSLTTHLGFYNENELSLTIADLIDNSIKNNIIDEKEYIMKHPENVDLIPSSLDLSVVQLSLVNAMCREYALKSGIQELKNNYDYVLIDCPPSFDMITINVLATSDSIIIPVEPQFLAARVTGQLLDTISNIKRKINPDLKIKGMLLSLVDKRTNLSKETIRQLQSNYGEVVKIYDIQIPRLVKIAEASTTGKSILSNEKLNFVSSVYINLAKEVIKDARTKNEFTKDYER